MADQKGRGGKKPKYQIADIGGPDLTSQDKSTERVLNFLIKGEMGPGDQAPETESDATVTASSAQHLPPSKPAAESTESSLPPSESNVKKSLAHLFQRASGGGGTAKDLKLDLGAPEPLPPTPSPGEVTKEEQAQQIPTVDQAKSVADRGVSHTRPPSSKEISPPAALPTPAVRQPAAVTSTAPAPEVGDLTQLISLWKSFYRLNAGEVEAMSALYRMSHALGSSECHVKMHKLAEDSDLTYRYCQKVVRSLEQLGWITKIKDYDPSTQLGVLYRINLKPSV